MRVLRWPGAAARATIYTGARGSGKTVMLNAVEDRARELGWLVVSETASPGFVDRIVRQELPRLLKSFDPKAVRRRLTGITGPAGTGGVSWSTTESHAPEATLRSQVELITDLLAENETGLLITLDEIHQNQIAELRQLATTVQHAFERNGNWRSSALGWPWRSPTSSTTKCSPSSAGPSDTPWDRSPAQGCRAGNQNPRRRERAQSRRRRARRDGARHARVPVPDPAGRRAGMAAA